MIGQDIGRYRITRQVGAGGMGVVYEALHRSIGQRVAVKVLYPAYSAQPAIVSRFFNEARAVNIVQHEGLVKAFDFGYLSDGTAYMMMELLDGQSLQSRLQRLGGKLPLRDALRISRQVASALAAAHAKGIIHRDLKPDNVFLVPDSETLSGERTKLLDFGVAKVRAASVPGQLDPNPSTASGALLGTPLYMAPEQCMGADGVDDKADVYSLGVMLYQMLAGRPPFTGKAPGAVMAAQMTRQPPPLRQAAPEVPEGVTALVHRMLLKTPAERPPIVEVVAELRRLGAPQAAAGPTLSVVRAGVASVVAAVLTLALDGGWDLLSERNWRVAHHPPVAAAAPAPQASPLDRPAGCPAPGDPVVVTAPAPARPRPATIARRPPKQVASPPAKSQGAREAKNVRSALQPS